MTLLDLERLLRRPLADPAGLAPWRDFKKERGAVRAAARRRVEEKLEAARSGG